VPIEIDSLITSIEVELEQAIKTRDKAIGQVKYMLKMANQEGRSNLSTDETNTVKDLFTRRDEAKTAIEGIESRLEMAKRAKAEELEVAEQQRERHDAGLAKPAYDRVMRVGREERTYRPDVDRKGAGFLRDVARQFLFNDAEAAHRLQQHMIEERVERGPYLERAAGDTTTANWAGLTVPQYLTDMYAPAVANLRPFADICNHHDLPASGMTINISQVTTASGVALQASELGAVQATSLDDTLLTENVQTASGQQTLSRQAIDRGTGIEEVTMQDLFRRYATALDSTLLTQSVTGVSALCNAAQIAYTTGSPTAAGLYPKILAATSTVETALLAQAIPTHAVMHSRRWYWLQSQLGSTWPLFGNPLWDAQSGGHADNVGYNKGIRGRLPMGLGVVVDNNVLTNLGVGTNQDELYVVASDECHLWEDPNAPVYIRAEQPKAANLGVLLVLYGYFAYTMRRYASAIGSVGGTGLVTPVF